MRVEASRRARKRAGRQVEIDGAEPVPLPRKHGDGHDGAREDEPQVDDAHRQDVAEETADQIEPRLVQTVVGRTAVRTAALDSLGADIAAGADAWFTILRRMGNSFAGCLDGT